MKEYRHSWCKYYDTIGMNMCGNEEDKTKFGKICTKECENFIDLQNKENKSITFLKDIILSMIAFMAIFITMVIVIGSKDEMFAKGYAIGLILGFVSTLFTMFVENIGKEKK